MTKTEKFKVPDEASAAAVMLLHGTDEQKKEAMDWVRGQLNPLPLAHKVAISDSPEHRLATAVARCADPGSPHLEYVLCVWKRDGGGIPTEWVVWLHNKQDKGFYFGHYCRSISEAAKFFEEKTKSKTRD